MPNLKRVEALFSTRKYAEALPIVVELKNRFPHVEYLRWVEASCLWNMGQRKAAQVAFAELKEQAVYFTKPLEDPRGKAEVSAPISTPSTAPVSEQKP
jgi:hypothetical protein